MDRRAIYRSWWYAHLPTFLVCLGVVGVAASMSTTPEVVSLFGWDIPPVCTWRRWLGIECPGCGMTRSFVFMAHGDVVSAFGSNKLGPPLFLAVAAQIPYRLWAMGRARVEALRRRGVA